MQRKTQARRCRRLSRRGWLERPTAMAFTVEPAPSEATRQAEWGAIWGRAGRNAVSCPSAPRARATRSSPPGFARTALTLHLGRGGFRYCPQGPGLPGPKSANRAEARGCRNPAFVSGLLPLAAFCSRV